MTTRARRPKDGRLLDAHLRRLHEVARLLPALTAHNGIAERKRLIAAVSRGDVPVPRFEEKKRAVPRDVWSWVDEARELADDSPARSLYLARLEELELDLAMLESLCDARTIRPLAARRFGTGRDRVRFGLVDVCVSDVASAVLRQVEPTPEPRSLPATALFGEPSLAELIKRVARHAGLEVDVRVEPRLSAGAATGERVVFIADRDFGAREALRLAVHEVLGHLVAAANGRAQPLRLVELGTAGSFGDQEGVALLLEERAGVMDGQRLRTLAARVFATDRMHDGAPFGETAMLLAGPMCFAAEDAVAICERAYRGGGVARDVGYMRGWLRVRGAVDAGRTTIDELRLGRIGLDDIETLRVLANEGLVVRPVYRPSLAYNLDATEAGTSLLTSPPSVAASLTRLELT